MRELKIWMDLDHGNIAPLLGFALDDEICIVSPWYVNGNVADYITKHPEVDRLQLVSFAKLDGSQSL